MMTATRLSPSLFVLVRFWPALTRKNLTRTDEVGALLTVEVGG